MRKKTERISLCVGVALLIGAILMNPLLLTKVFSPKGHIQLATKILIVLIEVCLFTIGVFTIWARKSREKLLGVIATVLMCVIGLAIGEVGCWFVRDKELRIELYESNPMNPRTDNVSTPEHLGYRMKPNLDLTVDFMGVHSSIKTNSRGFRWRDFTDKKPAGKTRIAFVGASIVFGLWADSNEHTMVGQFDSLMDHEKVETINFGGPGASVDDIEVALKENLLAFEPDYVVYVFSSNIFRDAWLGLERNMIEKGAVVWRPEIVEKKIPPEYMSPPSDNIYNYKFSLGNELLFRIINSLLTRYKPNEAIIPSFASTSCSLAVSPYFTRDTFWVRRPYPPIAEKAKDKALATLARINALVKQHGGKFVLINFPSGDVACVDSDAAEGYDIRYPGRYVENFAKKAGIPYYDTLDDIRAFSRKTGKYPILKGEGHPTTEGHQVAGEAMARFFKRELLGPN